MIRHVIEILVIFSLDAVIVELYDPMIASRTLTRCRVGKILRLMLSFHEWLKYSADIVSVIQVRPNFQMSGFFWLSNLFVA